MRLKLSIAVYFAVTTCISFFTYFHSYAMPPHFFWDENYHVSHAQKYLNGIFFMEPHPPLGKLLIALGERLIGANRTNDQFIGTDHAKDKPEGFSFAGYRFFPALMGWLSAPLFFLVLLLLLQKPLWALLLGFVYTFDNALIVHERGAMLESPQLFFLMVCLLSFLVIWRYKDTRRLFWIGCVGFGLTFAGVMSTKINGLILILLVPALLVRLWPNRKRIVHFVASSLSAFVVLYVTIWHIHFRIATKINPTLPDKGYYQASESYKELLADGRTGSLFALPTMLRDSFQFIRHYEKGVPVLNLCNQNENGSPFYFWPFGGRTINYRWERNNNITKYLYLVPNPATWGVSLLGVVLGFIVLLGSWLLPLKERPTETVLLGTLLAMYTAYMVVMASLGRVMYLYHYFIPLIFGWMLFALALKEIRRFGPLFLSDTTKSYLLVPIIGSVLGCYYYFSPLTYYLPQTDSELVSKAWLGIWDLRTPTGKYTNGVAAPTCDPKIKPFPEVYISGLRAESAIQEWGEPEQGKTVEEQKLVVGGVEYTDGIGTHANSTIRFKVRRQYSTLHGKVGLPDYLLQKPSTPASVKFEIYGDGRSIWSSPIVHPGESALSFDISIRHIEVLELKVRDGGDGIDNDHACWLELSFGND